MKTRARWSVVALPFASAQAPASVWTRAEETVSLSVPHLTLSPKRQRISDPFLGQPPTIDLAVAALTGISGGAAFVVPTLLMPGWPDFIPPADGCYYPDPVTGLIVRFAEPGSDCEISYEPTLEDG